MIRHLHDIETFWPHFELSIKEYKSDQRWNFQVNEFKDDRLALKKYLRTFNGFSIGFNSQKYDFAVLEYIDKNNYWVNESWQVFCENTKAFSDELINTEDETFVYQYLNHSNFKFTIIDLYLYWAKLLRLSKKISLKALGIQLGYPVVQELPYPPDIQELSKKQIDEIHHYCSIHDLGILELLMIQLEGIPGQTTVPLGNLGTVALREQIQKDFGINAWSMDAPKIASEALINEICRLTGFNKKTFLKLRFSKPPIKFKDLFQDIVFDFKTDTFKQVFNEWMNSIDTFSKIFIAHPKTAPACRISVGVGGLHQVVSNKIYIPEEDELLVDIDIASLYPQLILNYKAFRFPKMLEYYDKIRQYRLTETKPALKKYKGTEEETYWKQRDLFYKVVLNGISGHLDSVNSPLYYPEGIMKVRCGGQLILLTLIEKCIIADIEIIQNNTDGLTIRIKKNRLDEFKSFVEETERLYNVEFEYAFYKKMIFSNVNSYLAIDDKDEVKQKGEFVTKPELGNSTDMLIVPLALNAYFINDIKPEEFIRNPGHHIYLFCLSKKCDKTYTVEWNGSKQQRLNRYYASTKGAYLYKWRDGKKSHMMKDSSVMLYNSHVDKPMIEYNINYSYYLKQINDKINDLQGNQQLSLF